MRILFLTRLCWPHVGGVERHVERIAERLQRIGYKVTTISEEDIQYPHLKFLGLVYIWFWLLKNIDLIKQSDIVHCHDVFIWYLPFRFLYPKKPVYVTFHGWEGIWPLPWKNIFYKRLAAKLSSGTIAVGKYLEKYYGIKANYITYGGVDLGLKTHDFKKSRNSIVYLGRLEKDTGILDFLRWFRSLDHGYKVEFVGEGTLHRECEKYGKVHGFVKPEPYLRKAEYCVPGGYLSYLEAKAYGCKIITFYHNPLKKDYWQEMKKLKTIPTWAEVAKIYENLYGHYCT